MKYDNAIRLFSIVLLGLLIGLLAARIPSFDQKIPGFSWVGFSIGIGITMLAYLLSRPVVSSVNKKPPGTPLQRTLFNMMVLFFLSTLLFFNLFIYTGWVWSKGVLMFTIVCGGLSVFAGAISILFGSRQDA